VSRAFTKEDDSTRAAPVVVPRAPLPAGVPNYVTPRGLRLLSDELELLRSRPVQQDEAEVRAVRVAELEARRASAVLVPAANQAQDEIRFGATVTVRSESGELRSFQIVGVDEADAAAGKIAFTAPLARALLGKRSGETALVRAPRGDEELEIVAVTYELA
jgi:transcription elongation factor GreB